MTGGGGPGSVTSCRHRHQHSHHCRCSLPSSPRTLQVWSGESNPLGWSSGRCLLVPGAPCDSSSVRRSRRSDKESYLCRQERANGPQPAHPTDFRHTTVYYAPRPPFYHAASSSTITGSGLSWMGTRAHVPSLQRYMRTCTAGHTPGARIPAGIGARQGTNTGTGTRHSHGYRWTHAAHTKRGWRKRYTTKSRNVRAMPAAADRALAVRSTICSVGGLRAQDQIAHGWAGTWTHAP